MQVARVGKRTGARRTVHCGMGPVVALLAVLPVVQFTLAPRAAGGEDIDVSLEAVVADARSYLVPVEIELRKDKGEYPDESRGGPRMFHVRRFTGFSGRSHIDRRIPLRLPGLVWDTRHVLVPDACPPARFIKSISVVLDGEKIPARFSGHFRRAACALVEILVEDAGDPHRGLPGRKALEFAPAPEDPFAPLVSAAFDWDGAGWKIAAGVVGGDYVATFGTPSGERSFRTLRGPALLYDETGRPVGYTSSGRLTVAGQGEPWRGTELRGEEVISAHVLERRLQALGERLGRLALEVRLTFRREEKKEGRGMFSYRSRSFRTSHDSERDAESNEWHGTGFVVRLGDDGPQMILVPADIGREPLVRTEKIDIRAPGEESRPQVAHQGGTNWRPARFVGAHRDLGAIVIEPKGPPSPDLFKEWLDVTAGAEFRHDELFISAAVDYATGKRRVRLYHDRLAGWGEGFKGRIQPGVHRGSREGLAAFTLEGKLLGLALSVRLPPSGERYRREFEGPSLLPARQLALALEAPDPYDAALKPLAKEQEKRIVWLGVEFQRLTADLARANKAEIPTRAGKLGLLVTHVYRGSPAEGLGLKKSDVLLRLEPEDGSRPVDLEGNLIAPDSPYADFMHMIDEVPEQYRARVLGEMPPPWPPQLNGFNDLLTKLGEGEDVRLTYLREGKPSTANLTLEFAPPHFESATPLKIKDLGLTVKELTYEVRQYYRLSDDEPGLVIAGIEPGGKAALGKMFPYSLVRRVNGRAVRTISEFKDIHDAVKSGKPPRVLKITVEHFGKTRLVKITL